MTLDPARSKRSEKPGLFATIDMALIQAGVAGTTTADDIYAPVAWAMKWGRKFPWYYAHEEHILYDHGGKDAVILTLAGAAIRLVAEGEHPAEAAWRAAVEWRATLRRQWGDGAPNRKAWRPAMPFSALKPRAKHVGVGGPDENPGDAYTTEDWLTEHALELAQPGPESFDPDNIQDPRLQALWDRLTPREREGMTLIADGLDFSGVGEHMGIGRRSVLQLQRKVRVKARAMGAAG